MDDKMEDADQPSQWLHSKHSSAPADIFGEAVKKTRIGDEYQAQIPPLMTENERLQLIVMPSSHDGKIDVEEQLMLGQSIPVVWIQDQPESNKETMQNQANAQESAKGESGVIGSGLIPVPGSSIESLSPDEHHSFLLGLYIFGKNFHAVNRFMGNKGMRNVLSYYYGKFYRTGEHQKWLKYKKMKGKKTIVPGKNIFSDWRHEELFSRLLPRVTDKCITSLTQASKRYEDGELSFQRYVFAIRDIVGMDLLIDSIGIGKGKRDLTNRPKKKPVKKKILPPDYSSLKTEEIVNLLKVQQGDKIKKPKLSEFFWEAVWPRLLARGWHSEKTVNYAFQSSSKNSFVFLAPGVDKFSRRGLHKGIQYFESFNDVLNKVALEPQLLEPEPEPIQESSSPVEQDHMQFRIMDIGINRVENGVVRKAKLRSMSDHTESADDTQTPESFSSGETIQDSNTTAATPDSDGVEPLLLPIQPFVFLEMNPMDGGDNYTDQEAEAALNGERPGTRNRVLTQKALEGGGSESMNPKKKKNKKRYVEDNKGTRHVRAKTALATSSDSGNTGNEVDS